MKKLIAGNWKMNCSLDEAKHLIANIINGVDECQEILDRAELTVCPPYIYLPAVRHACATTDYTSFGAQDCSAHDNGAYTGEVSASMLDQSACKYVIVGHSERRQFHGETDQLVQVKAKKVHENNMSAIICVGETESQRLGNLEKGIVKEQILNSLPQSANENNTVIAYEPVWAIGTGKVASADDVREMHDHIREVLRERMSGADKVRILYGGSVKPDNAEELLGLENVNGALIGGASLKAESFIGIAKHA